MLCTVKECQEPAIDCSECGSYVCQTHGLPRDPQQHGAPLASFADPEEDWLCHECARKLAQRTWSRLSN